MRPPGSCDTEDGIPSIGLRRPGTGFSTSDRLPPALAATGPTFLPRRPQTCLTRTHCRFHPLAAKKLPSSQPPPRHSLAVRFLSLFTRATWAKVYCVQRMHRVGMTCRGQTRGGLAWKSRDHDSASQVGRFGRGFRCPFCPCCCGHGHNSAAQRTLDRKRPGSWRGSRLVP